MESFVPPPSPDFEPVREALRAQLLLMVESAVEALKEQLEKEWRSVVESRTPEEGLGSSKTVVAALQPRHPPQEKPNIRCDPVCAHCGRGRHTWRNCKFRTGRCFACNKKGHVAAECPQQRTRRHGRHCRQRGRRAPRRGIVLENAPGQMASPPASLDGPSRQSTARREGPRLRSVGVSVAADDFSRKVALGSGSPLLPIGSQMCGGQRPMLPLEAASKCCVGRPSAQGRVEKLKSFL